MKITGTTSLTTMTQKNISMTINKENEMLVFQEKLPAVEQDRMEGRAGVALDEFEAILDKAINKPE